MDFLSIAAIAAVAIVVAVVVAVVVLGTGVTFPNVMASKGAQAVSITAPFAVYIAMTMV